MGAATLCGAGFAPAVAVGLGAFAADKVEAFALMKAVGLVTFIPVVAWFIPELWQWLAVVAPPDAAAKGWWLAVAGDSVWPVWLVLSVVGNAFALFALIGRWPKND